MRRDKAAYKLAIRTKEKDHVNDFSDSLNDALMSKEQRHGQVLEIIEV